MKDILIVYYSLDGSTQTVATALAEKLDADLLLVKPVKELNKTGFWKFFFGGMQAIFGKTPKLLPMDKSPGDYKNAIVGTPVWASTYTPPIGSLLRENMISGKRVAVFCCCEGGPGKTLEKLSEKLGKENVLIGSHAFIKPRESGSRIQNEIDSWAQELIEKMRSE